LFRFNTMGPMKTEWKHEHKIIKCFLSLVPRSKGELPVILVDERAAEVRAIKEG